LPSDFALSGVKTKSMKSILLTALVSCNIIEVLAAEHYVNQNNPTPSAPYLSWATAATNIQAAIDVASYYDVITVTNGLYQTGGSTVPSIGYSNRVSITKPLVVRSVNGPGVTVIDGGSTIRCVALVSSSVLSGFTLTNGYTRGEGGGVIGDNYPYYNPTLTSILTNCIITGNVASNYGGGATFCCLDSCAVRNNYSGQGGGGTSFCYVNNSTIVNNSAHFGGGCNDFALTNCFISGNSAAFDGGGAGAALGIALAPQPTPYFVNCSFVNNHANGTDPYGLGGGVYGGCSIYNCTFTNNSANFGGAVNNASLSDCTLVGNQATLGGGATYSSMKRCLVLGNSAKKGGGVFGGYIPRWTPGFTSTDHCLIAGNSASVAGGGIYGYGHHEFAVITNNFAQDGGGFASDDSVNDFDYFSTEFINCEFSGNWATNRGGAVYESCLLDSCTIAGNSAGNEGGGVCGNSNNYPDISASILYHNSAPLYPNCDTISWFADSCTVPMPPNGNNNITNDPGFANIAAGNFRLGSNSPCINFLHYPNASVSSDLDGNPRVVSGGMDIGAYEFQTPASGISYFWLQQYGLPTDGSADHADTDGDHFDNWSEWIAHTSPLDAASLLKILQVVPNGDSATVTWQSVPGLSYYVERSTNLAANPRFDFYTFVGGAADTNVTSFVDAGGGGPGPVFYRIEVQ
jgi:hypothetical protein